MWRAVLALAAGFALMGAVIARDAVPPGHPELPPLAEAGPALPFPVALTPRFDLIDHTGREVSERDFAGRPMVLFFGFAQCEAICDVALPRMAEALDLLGAEGEEIAPVMITIDPENDTPKALAEAMPKWHPRFIGLTGSDAALAAARDVFQVTAEKVAEDPAGIPIYSHGSFIYLIGPDGSLRTVIPPILGPERMAQLMRKYFLG